MVGMVSTDEDRVITFWRVLRWRLGFGPNPYAHDCGYCTTGRYHLCAGAREMMEIAND
jgi:hypothetical protein